MKTYKVTWTIDIEADNPTEAAVQAYLIQQDPESCATVFEVDGQQIDLDYTDDERNHRLK